jgi:hypothetical protein
MSAVHEMLRADVSVQEGNDVNDNDDEDEDDVDDNQLMIMMMREFHA